MDGWACHRHRRQVLYNVTDKEISLLIGAPFLMFFYVTTVVYLYHKTRVRTVLQSFSAVGRMAFTNYLMQSIVCTWIFYHYAWACMEKCTLLPVCSLQLRFVPFKWPSATFGFVSFGWGRLSGCGEALRICRGSLL